jgi:hypothetical protein
MGGENMRSKDKLAVGKALIYFSVVCVILALMGALGNDLWLASTQWMLVGLTSAIWAVFVLIEAEYRMKR